MNLFSQHGSSLNYKLFLSIFFKDAEFRIDGCNNIDITYTLFDHGFTGDTCEYFTICSICAEPCKDEENATNEKNVYEYFVLNHRIRDKFIFSLHETPQSNSEYYIRLIFCEFFVWSMFFTPLRNGRMLSVYFWCSTRLDIDMDRLKYSRTCIYFSFYHIKSR